MEALGGRGGITPTHSRPNGYEVHERNNKTSGDNIVLVKIMKSKQSTRKLGRTCIYIASNGVVGISSTNEVSLNRHNTLNSIIQCLEFSAFAFCFIFLCA
jgi:hypothetical protein